MKRIGFVWGVCALLLSGSFGVLVVEDRHLGVPLPYSVPLAFACTLFLASALFAIAQALLARRPVRVVDPARVRAAVVVPPAPRVAPEGVVLLDCSRLVALSGQRA